MLGGQIKHLCWYWIDIDKNIQVHVYICTEKKHPVRVTLDATKCHTVQHLEFIDERSQSTGTSQFVNCLV